ncbi:sporulation protein YjcZ [Paenibacillus sp. YPG26]|nr:sporulation protein YjcZ [Paenibacillus sp. YPG26]USB32560.1 sporulation protein YjcZ [Paenibacillus sp. YPG26]
MSHVGQCGPGAGVGLFWTSTGTILVLYILLVIILRTPFF